MRETSELRERVFRLVAEGRIDADTAMELIRSARGEPRAVQAAPPARDIAVIGMAGRFGDAPDLESYWRMLEAGGNCLREMPERRWPASAGKRRRGGFLPDENLFDPLFFRISPTEAALMDPQQRLFLETAYLALEDAGYADSAVAGARCGVFVGVGAGDYTAQLREVALQADPFGLMGNVASILAARISYFLDLKGPSIAVDSACSSSLVAVHLACESLQAGTCDMAVAGGVAVISTPAFISAASEAGMLSPNDRCATFDAAADGFACGEGSGAVVLKRLADAVRDGDTVLGVIRGSGINQDGRTNGITAPSAPAQAALEQAVYRSAGIDPAGITYIEAHGTGTPLGDPIEIEALTTAFRGFTDRTGFCALGSVKANLGHALTAAGIAGLLKLLLMLRHRRLPPLAGFAALNPRLDLASSPFRIPTKAEDWDSAEPRRAAVSSFGFSGTNAHLVVEEPPVPAPRPAASGPFLFLLSGRSELVLRQRATALADRLADADIDPRDLAFTLAAGREHASQRLAIVAEDGAGLRAALQAWVAGQEDPAVFAGLARPGGPGPALTELGRQTAARTSDLEGMRILADLYVQGASLPWRSLQGVEHGRRVPLPGTPFERMACGLNSAPTAPAMVQAVRPEPEPGRDQLGAVQAALVQIDAPDLAGRAEAFAAIEAWGRRALADAYARMGLFARPAYTVAGLRKALGIAPAAQRLHDALTDILLREGALLRQEDLLRPRGLPQDAARLEAERAEREATTPELAPFVALLARCVGALPELLAAKVTATEIMFPDGRMDLVEPIYAGNPLAEHFNALLARAAAALAPGRGGAFRVLEIGAGTGGATGAILNALQPTGAALEYHYTDISHGFVQMGRQRFGHDFMRFASLDIEKDPVAQGFAAGGFDLVIASNVVHASRRIDVTLGHAALLLRPGGALLLNEVTALQDFATLTFGLTTGWWAFEDAERRIPHAPLLDGNGWRDALASAGFPDVAAFGLPGEDPARRSQSVIVALRDHAAMPVQAAAPVPVPAAMPIAATSAGSDALEALIAQQVAAALTLPPERIDLRGRFMDYGIDSILGGQVVSRLNAALGLALRPTVLFDNPSVADLARFIAREHAPVLPPTAPATTETPHAPAARVVTPPEIVAADERIAIIGMAGRFADCADLDAFHAMLRDGRSGITEVPADRWSADPETLPSDVRAEARFLRWGGFLKDAGAFDPLFFRMSGKEAELTDPQHRVFLMEAWHALEHAGYGEAELDGRRCGVFVGAYGGDYTHRMTDLGISPEAFAFMGNAAAILAARIAYVLNLKGPSLAVDTACSSSLSAAHLACRSLLAGECEMALAGGVFLTTTMGFNTAAAKAGMLSPEGACKTFDASADGFVPGEGAGVVVLKPYARALADGDHIEAVILASAMNQDGKTNGITAPSPESQAALETEVYQRAGIDPAAITYVEAHGTGTRLGDPIEIEGLTRAFRRWTDRTGFCAIGSVKTNIGHAAHAAGIAGLIKTVLSLHHRTLFPSLHFRTENPELRLAETPFVVNTAARPWETGGAPRLAAVSSFGFSGTNVHILLAEAEPAPPRELPPGPQLVAVSARSKDALGRQMAALRNWLANHPAALPDIARTLNGGRTHFEHRWAAIVTSVDTLLAALGAGPDRPGSLAGDMALRQAAEAWLAGAAMPASAIPAAGRRIVLPGYPFETHRYWLDRAETPAPVPARAHYFAPAWQEEATPAISPQQPIGVLGGNEGFGAALVASWRQQGREIRLLSGEADLLPATAPAFIVDARALGSKGWNVESAFALARTLFAVPARLLVLHPDGEPTQESVAALHRSMRFDGAAVDLRLLGLPAMPRPEIIAEAIAAELAGSGHAIQAVLRDGRRLVRRMEPLAAGTPGALRRGGHFLITGGGGRLGALFARRFVQETGGRVTLLGRSAATETLRDALASSGDAIAYRQADVTDPATLAAAIAAARTAFGPIHGVIHAAGVPGGTLLRESSAAEVASCLAPKVAGTVALDQALANEELDFFVIFSSLAGELGDFGQGSYAVANAFCDRFAAWRTTQVGKGLRQGRSVALGWPLWREGRGVLSAEGERIYLATAGIPYLETDQGWQAFLDALGAEAPQIAVIPGDPESARALFGRRETAPVPVPQQPVVTNAAPVVAADLHDAVRTEVTRLVSVLLKLDTALLLPGTGLAEFGFDSIALKEFAVRLGHFYGIEISPAVFFAHGTIEAVAGYLVATYPAETAARHTAAQEPTPMPAPARPAAPRSVAGEGAIAIIGMSGRFPQAPDLDVFWQKLRDQADLVGPLPAGRELAAQRPYDRAALRGGFLDRIDTFDAAFFRISPREACFLDPQHRFAIEAVWHCAEDAAIRMSGLAGRSVGVFFGPQVNEYGAIIPDRDAARAQIALGNIATMLPNRISYLFDLRGPSEAIDTACSSSLAAVHRAVRALQAGECEMAFAGGVSLVLTAESIVSTAELGVVSPDGRCYSFDARANGYVKGEGIGVVLLKPLARAEADGDVIHAVILGSAENHGGHAHSLTAPNGTAQASLIATALRRAGVPSDTIGYLEAHGTGTELGDPVEVMALKEAFAATAVPGTVADPACALGTVKTNIGHLEPASGIAGLIKTVLALRHRTLPASLNFDQVNPLIDFSNTPFAVADRTRPWDVLRDPNGQALPRRAGVSSFGLGGSNAHVVLQEPPPVAPDPADAAPQLLLVSARDRARLAAMLRRLADYARQAPDLPVRDVAHTLAVGREAMETRVALLWRPGQVLANRLAAAATAVERERDGEEIWLGSVAKPGLAPAESTGAQQFLADLLASGQLSRLGALWANGAALPPGATEGRRISVPGAQFARESFWFDGGPAGLRTPEVTPQLPALPPEPELPVPPFPASTKAAPGADAVRNVVRRQLAAALYLDEAQLDDRAGFADLGLDSILAVELTKSLNDELGTSLQATRLYDYANVAELSAYLHAECAATGAAPQSPAEPAIPQAGVSLASVQATVRHLLATALYLDEAQIDDRAGFADLGLDSILAVELAKSLNDELGTALQATRLYDYANVAELAAYLHASLVPADAQQISAGSPEADFLFARLGSIAGPGLSLRTRLDSISLQPAEAKTILAEVNAHFGCALTETDVGRCPDLGSLARRIATTGSARPAIAEPIVVHGEAVQATTETAVLSAPAPTPAPAVARQVAAGSATPEIAIIGYACRLPGAPDAEAFWHLLCAGTPAISDGPPDPWRNAAYRAQLAEAGTALTPWGGFVADVDRFDAVFFNIPPEQARVMDPVQRLFLESAWHALEMAGQTRARLDGAECGVFVGGGASDYARLLQDDPSARGAGALLGNTASILAARLAYFLNLRGPCMALDTACSSGLVALHQAWRAIGAGECEMAVVGGVNLMLTPQMHAMTGAGGMLAADGRCKSFDNRGDGFVPAEGIVTLVLKRLDLAQADGDPVQGIVRGMAVNQNGTTAGITAPSARAQSRLLRAAYERGAIDPIAVGLIEAHGTGTKIGDALEFEALRTLFACAGAAPGSIRLGSAKPVIGHALAASGLASVVKLLLGFRHEAVPPTILPQVPNEHMQLERSPLRINGTLEPWPRGGRARLAATTAYGLSGTNAHAILAEPPENREAVPGPHGEWHLIPVSGTDRAALDRQVAALAEALATASWPIADLAHTLGVRRTHFAARAAFLARSTAELAAGLAAWPDTLRPTAAPDALAEMVTRFEAGEQLDWAELASPGRTLPDLPGYRFARTRFWPDERPATPERMEPARWGHDLGGQLRQIVASVLRVDPARVAPDLPFAELGLDSVASATIASLAADAFKVTVTPLAVYDNPTLNSLARFIAAQPSAAPANPNDPLVPVRREGEGQPSFWVHGGTGDVNWVPELARQMPGGPVYGLQAQGIDGVTDPLPDVEQMAAHYVAALRRVQPEGPYWIGGYSGGGIIAFEMAHQLVRAGENVSRLVLLDANAPGNDALPAMQASFGPGYVYLVVGNWLGRRWGMTAPLVLADLAGRDKPAMLDHVVAHLMRHARPPVPESAIRHQLAALDRIGWHIGAALRAYVAQRLDGAKEVLLFECRDGMAGAENPLGLPDDPATHGYRDGWADLLGTPITHIPVACDHFGLFAGAAGAEVGAHLSVPSARSSRRAQVETLVLGLVREILPDAPAEAVVPERSMTELGATSIDRVEVATLAMEALGLTVPHQELARVGTIGELIEALHRHLGAGPPGRGE